MADEQEIAQVRDSGGTADIGTNEDGAIIEMVNMSDRIIVIKEKALYEFYLADKINPARTNISLPNNIQSLLIDQGSDSELVGRTFLTAKTLFKKGYFEKSKDVNKALLFSLDALMEFIALEQELNNLLVIEKKASDEYERIRLEGGEFVVPSIPGVETKCKTIFQKADHIEQILLDIIKIFFPKISKKSFHIFLELLKRNIPKKTSLPNTSKRCFIS